MQIHQGQINLVTNTFFDMLFVKGNSRSELNDSH